MSLDKRLKCGIYARVSTTDKGQTTENQLEPLRELANRNSWQVFDYYEDEMSAVKYRPNLRRMLKDIKRRKFDILLVTKIDRLARSMKELLALIDEIVVASKVRLWFVDQNLDVDPKNPANMLTVHILGAMAEFERQLISERVKAGMDRAKNKGANFGQPRKHIDPVRLKELREAGRSLTELQKEFKVSRNTVLKNLREQGLIVNPIGKFREQVTEHQTV